MAKKKKNQSKKKKKSSVPKSNEQDVVDLKKMNVNDEKASIEVSSDSISEETHTSSPNSSEKSSGNVEKITNATSIIPFSNTFNGNKDVTLEHKLANDVDNILSKNEKGKTDSNDVISKESIQNSSISYRAETDNNDESNQRDDTTMSECDEYYDRPRSVTDTVKDIEKMDNGKVVEWSHPGMKALPGLASVRLSTSNSNENRKNNENNDDSAPPSIKVPDSPNQPISTVDKSVLSGEAFAVPLLHSSRVARIKALNDAIHSAHSSPRNISENKISEDLRLKIQEDQRKSDCILENSMDEWKPFDIMDTASSSSTPRSRLSTQSSNVDSELIESRFLKSLNKIVRVLQEFLDTEIKFSIDVNSLKTVLSEIKYSTLNSSRNFVHSVPYVGILVSTESIKVTSNLLVKLFQESEILPRRDSKGQIMSFTEVSECFECFSDNCKAVFNGLERCAPFFPLFASFIINHDGLSLLYREYIANDEEFKEYMCSAECFVGEGLLSLLIKPVQRLPRYVLLCREIHSSIEKALDSIDESYAYYERMNEIYLSSKKTLDAMRDFTTACNDAVRNHQDNLRMHSLQQAFEESSSDDLMDNLVSNRRCLIREGKLMRQHKHAAMKYHEFQVFSDVLLTSTANGTALRLEHVITLDKGSDTLCLPVPVMFDAESTWFYVLSKKILYCSADTTEKRDAWVSDITSCLVSNQADSDFYRMKKQIAWVNTIMSEINRLWKQSRETSGLKRHQEEAEWRDSSMDPVYIQVSWWRMLGILKKYEVDGQKVSHKLQRVIDLHAKEVVNRILQSTSLMDSNENLVPSTPSEQALSSLLLDDKPHYLIASGFFFETPSYSKGSSLDDGVRPFILRLFLLSDVLVAAYVDNSAAPLRYAFHIEIKNLLCFDYRAEVGPTAMQLIDESVQLQGRRFSLFGNSSDQKKRERIIFAPSLEIKFDWLSLMMQTCDTYRNVPPGSSLSGSRFDELVINRIPLPLQRVGAMSSATPWDYEEKILKSSR